MMFKHKKMIGLLFFSALVALALLFVVSYTAMAQENWPAGEDSGEPAIEADAKVVEGAADGQDSTGDDEKVTDPEGGKIERDFFRARFPGKSIRSADGEVGIRIVKEGTAKGSPIRPRQ